MPKTLADVTVVTYIRYIDTRKREIRSQRKECGWCGLKHVTSCFRWTHFWKLWTKPDRFWAGASRCMTTSLTEETTVDPQVVQLRLKYLQTPSVLSAVRVHATWRVSMMTCTVRRSAFCRNTVMTTPISRSRLITIFLYSVISPCCPKRAISAADTGWEKAEAWLLNN